MPVISKLQKFYHIRLVLVVPENGIDYQNYVNGFLGISRNVDILYVYQNSRQRSIKNISLYNHIINLSKAFNPDIYYISLMGMPYALPLYRLRLPINKCVVPCHNASTPKGASSEKKAEVYKNLWLKTFKNIQVFSKSQFEVLKSMHTDKNVLLAYLMLKDYGVPHGGLLPPNDKIGFLFFGNIVRYKRLDLLLEAVNILVERGEERFCVTIAGNCKDWDQYSELIKYPEFVKTRIERIPNEDAADLFASSHYCVLPYQDIAQSGAITVAFRYNLPTIVSDIPQFNEFVVDGKTSLSFKSQDAAALADTMQYAIEHHRDLYNFLKINQQKWIDAKFADEAIVSKFREFFEQI